MLLKIVALLHRSNVVHNDICLSTVFVAGTFEPDSDLDSLLLSGFSEASDDLTRAKNNCYQIFRTVQEFVGEGTGLPKCWTVDEHLDRLWHHLSEAGNTSRPYTVQEVCDLSNIGLGPKLEQPKMILVSKTFKFRRTSDMDVSYLAVEDVREYLSKDRVRYFSIAPSSYTDRNSHPESICGP